MPSLASQTATPSRDQQRVAAARVTEERVLRWGEGGLPPLPAKVTRLIAAFAGDGSFLVLQLENDWFCIDVDTGKVTTLPAGKKTLGGSVSGPRVHAWHQGGLSWVKLPSGDTEEVIPSGPAPRALGGGVAVLANASMRCWQVAPDGSRAVTSPPQIMDLGTGATIPFGDKRDMPTWASWDLDRKHVAVSMHRPDGKPALHVLDFQGKSLATFADSTLWYTELDLNGRSAAWPTQA